MAMKANDDRPSVNQLLASLRRTSLGANGDRQTTTASLSPSVSPSVPPLIRHFLHPGVPDVPPPPPPRRQSGLVPRVDGQGRRLPAGPPPPRSWLSLSRHQPPALDLVSPSGHGRIERRLLPGLYRPVHRSLMDIALRHMTRDWEYQMSYNRYHLYSLPDRVRVALISYLAFTFAPGLTVSALKTILLPQLHSDAEYEEHEAESESRPSPSSLNEGITHLDLTGCIGTSIKLADLSNFLFPARRDRQVSLLDSWETGEAPSIHRPLLPNLTHLSLAASPETSSLVSWKQLLAFSTYVPTLTHLSLAYWPVPSLTPNATFAKVMTPHRQSIQYGGANPYSHSLDDDWSEAILILRRLSQNLYNRVQGLEYLDLTGCSLWFKALTAHAHVPDADPDLIDWVNDWGKIKTLVLTTGYAPPSMDEASKVVKYRDCINLASGVERTIRARRAGRGQLIAVEADKSPEHVD